MLASQRAFQTQLIIEMLGSLILFAGCAGVVYWIEGRRFYRRNVAGLQQFHTFGTCVWTSAWERLFSLIARVTGVFALLLAAMLGIFIYIGHHLPQAQLTQTEARACTTKNNTRVSDPKCAHKTPAMSARIAPSS